MDATLTPVPTSRNLLDAEAGSQVLPAQGMRLLNGTHALLHLPILQRQRDERAGLNTAGFISGYRGSPLGSYDQALERAADQLQAHRIRFMPGVNEDLAATAVWGTQQIHLQPGARHDGVFGIWYGKGPGVDRSADVLRHANQAGTSAHGGVLAVAGDDHGCKSSSVSAQTDYLFQAVSMPLLAPATVQEFIDLGLHGLAMSRYAGVWVGFKCVTDCVESAGLVDLDPERVQILLPEDFAMPDGGVHIRWPEPVFAAMEERLNRYKLPAALAYARANRLDRALFGTPQLRLGIVTSGKAWLDVMQALDDLGIAEAQAVAMGLDVYRVVMPWPLEPQGLRTFAHGCKELLVVEEKRPLIEGQVREHLYGIQGAPSVLGKRDALGQTWLSDSGELDPVGVARVVARWLQAHGHLLPIGGQAHLDRIAAAPTLPAAPAAPAAARMPYFCSGCPHNSSTKVPAGARALAGIGCHSMALWMDRETATFTHMGGEGANWVGQAPFVDTPHVFQNLGDGTYFHSGYLAIRQAVAAGTTMTYKILFNDAVAMTGGQTHDGTLTPATIARQVLAEGVSKVVVVSDDITRYPEGYFPGGVEVHAREDLDTVQRALQLVPRVSVLIYDQTCAAVKRRRRKRDKIAPPPKRAFIHAGVCEGCGDCGVQSNCVSIEPLETELGRKRTINQSSCNQDLACLGGFCPSFVTLDKAVLRQGKAVSTPDPAGRQGPRLPERTLPLPERLPLHATTAILVAGIGGTGVTTIGQVLALAAHLEGHAVSALDVNGLAQKGGAVTSHVRIAPRGTTLHAPRIAPGAADTLIGCDLLVAGSTEVLARLRHSHTRVVLNTTATPTGAFTRDAQWRFPAEAQQAAIAQAAGRQADAALDAGSLAVALLGDAIGANMLLLGHAWQKGCIPLDEAAILQAIARNGVAVAMNQQAFQWGRLAAVDMALVEQLVRPAQVIRIVRKVPVTPEGLTTRHVAHLTSYQNAAYADRYRRLVDRVAAREAVWGGSRLTETVARSAFRLLAYKDEYEVARLYADPAFMGALATTFEDGFQLRFNLAPPLWSRRNAAGTPVTRPYGSWMMVAFRLLARLRWLRGTPFDPFGYTGERRMERALFAEYQATIDVLLAGLAQDAGRLDLAVEIAALPETMRGFGHVKQRNVAAAQARQRDLLARFATVGDPAIARQAA